MARNVRWFAVPLLLLGFFLATTPASMAHEAGPGFHHLSVDVRDLNATDSRTYQLESDEGPFREGWVFIVYGGVQGETPVQVNLTTNGTVVDQWVWTPGSFHKNTTRLPSTGDYQLTVWNPSNATTRYAFYFDQSCNCTAKAIPLPGGFVLFNYDLPADRRAFVGFPTLDGWHLKGAVATLRPDTQARWPHDFDILVEEETLGRGWINFTFDTPSTARYYVFMEALSGASLEDPVDLTPLVEVEEKKEASGASALAALSAAVTVVWARRRSR